MSRKFYYLYWFLTLSWFSTCSVVFPWCPCLTSFWSFAESCFFSSLLPCAQLQDFESPFSGFFLPTLFLGIPRGLHMGSHTQQAACVSPHSGLLHGHPFPTPGPSPPSWARSFNGKEWLLFYNCCLSLGCPQCCCHSWSRWSLSGIFVSPDWWFACSGVWGLVQCSQSYLMLGPGSVANWEEK